MAERKNAGLGLLVLLLTLIISVALVLGFFGRVHPAFDAFSHFRLHLAALLFLCGIAMFALHYRLHAAAAALLAAGCVGVTVPHFFQSEMVPAPTDQPVYKLLQLNAYYGNKEPKAVLSLIAREHPDIVTMEEVSDNWREELNIIKTAYPYRLDCGEGSFSTVILSRRSMNEGHNPYCAPNGRVALAQIDLNGRLIDVMALHLPWPWPFEQWQTVRDHAPLLQMLGDTAIAAGDFNAAPWSATVREVVALGGFTRIEHFGPTWIGHHTLPESFKFLGLPIDQVMTKGRIIVHSTRTLEAVGSDHLPVLVEFSIAPEEIGPEPQQTVLAAMVNRLRMP
ncbi:MAG: endonuclease/exonuclease/phosphatase family protein [Mesorhizobium sp.]